MKNVKTNQMNACRCNSEGAGVKMTSWLNNNFRLLALTLLAMLSVNVVWGEEIYRNEGTIGTSGGVTANGNINSTGSNGNPAPAFGNTSSSNTTFTFTGFDVSSYSNLELTMDVKWGQFPSTTNTFPKIVVTFYKDNVVVKTDDATVKVTSKVTTYNTYTITDIPDFDKIQLVSNPSVGKTAKGAASTVYSAYIDNIVLTGEAAPSCTNKVTVTKGAATGGTYTLKAGSASGAEIADGGTVDNCDANATIVVVPNADSHYHCTGVTAFNSASVTGPDGSGNYTITYTQGSSISSTINVEFAEDSKVTVTFSDAIHDNNSGYMEYVGDKIQFPTITDAAKGDGCVGEHYHFVGWTKDASQPNALVTPASETAPATDITYYAVWAKEDE